mgnify:CR=1 FL=1
MNTHDYPTLAKDADHAKKKLFFCSTWIGAEMYIPSEKCLEELLATMKALQGTPESFSVRVLYGLPPDLSEQM